MVFRLLFLVAAAGCAASDLDGPATPERGAMARLEPVAEGGGAATLKFVETRSGLAVTTTDGGLAREPLQMRITESCSTLPAVPDPTVGGVSGPIGDQAAAPPEIGAPGPSGLAPADDTLPVVPGPRATLEPALGDEAELAPPTGEDAGSTQAGIKGQRAASSPITADESGQAGDRMRPTTATPELRSVQLTPTADGWAAPELTVEEILGRAVILEPASGRLCGEVHPAPPVAPIPAG